MRNYSRIHKQWVNLHLIKLARDYLYEIANGRPLRFSDNNDENSQFSICDDHVTKTLNDKLLSLEHKPMVHALIIEYGLNRVIDTILWLGWVVILTEKTHLQWQPEFILYHTAITSKIYEFIIYWTNNDLISQLIHRRMTNTQIRI